MATIARIRASKRAFFDHLSWLAPLIARLTLAAVFIPAGYGKLTHLEKPIRYFAELGIPAPAFNATLVGSCELGCGVLLLAGIVARLATIPLIVTMIVALCTAKAHGIHGFGDLLGTSEFLYVVLLVFIAVIGAGAASIDHILADDEFGSGGRSGTSFD